MSWEQLMTQNWAIPIVSSLGSMYNKNLDTVWNTRVWIKKWYISRDLCKYC